MKHDRRTLVILSVGNVSCADIKIALFAVVIRLKADLFDISEYLLHIGVHLARLGKLAPIADSVKTAVGMRTANIDRLAFCCLRKVRKACSDKADLTVGKSDKVGAYHHHSALVAAADPHCADGNRIVKSRHFLRHLVSGYVISL